MIDFLSERLPSNYYLAKLLLLQASPEGLDYDESQTVNIEVFDVDIHGIMIVSCGGKEFHLKVVPE